MAVITVTDVPIFDEHGSFSRSDLEEIAANSQARIDDTGDTCPLTLGHTPKKGEKAAAPPIVGSARNFRVGQFGKTNPRACIFADFDIEAKHADLVREQYPRRSIELWPQDRVIDPIALLGATTPQRDLGLLTFERKSDGKQRYSKARDGEPQRHEMRDEAMFGIAEFMSLFLETPIGKYIQRKMEEDMQAEGVADVNADQVNKNAEELNAAEDGLDIEGGELNELGDDENTFDDEIGAGEGFDDEPEIPADDESPVKKKEPVKMAKQTEVEKLRMERDSIATKFAKLEDRLSTTEAKLAESEKKARRAEHERAFIQLESEGLQFERAEEMADCEDMTPEQFAKHCERMKKRYARSVPGNGRPLLTQPMSDGGGEPRKKIIATADQLEECHKYARDNKVSLNEAIKVFTK